MIKKSHIFIFVFFVFFLAQNYIVAAIAQRYLKDLGIEYSKVEGSLFQGITVNDLKYKDALSIKRVRVDYSLLYLLRATPKISTLELEKLFLDINKLQKLQLSNKESSDLSIIAFAISDIKLKNSKIIVEDESFEFDFKGEEFAYHESINVDKISLDFKSSYADGLINGGIESNVFKGDSSVELSKSISKEPLILFLKMPKIFKVNIELNSQKANLSTNFHNLALKDDIKLNLNFFFDNNSFQANLHTGLFDSNVSSKDYENFIIKADSEYFKAHGDFKLLKSRQFFGATLYPKLENKFFKGYPAELFSPLKIKYDSDNKVDNLNLDANLLHLKLSQKENHIDGFGTLGSSRFDIFGKTDKNSDTKIDISAKIDSIKKLLSELKLGSDAHEGKADINSTLIFGEKFSMKNDIHIPKYTFKKDLKRSYVVEDISISTVYLDKKLTINNYTATYMEHKFHSFKPSYFIVDNNITIQELWLYDNILITGVIDSTKKELNAHIKSDKFSYSFDDTQISLKADLKTSMDILGKYTMQGDITLLDASIDKEPLVLPFGDINASILADEKNIDIDIKAGPIDLYLSSKDYEHFIITAKEENLSLSFLDSIPKQLKGDKISFEANASMNISPFSIKGEVYIDDDYFKTEGEFEVTKNDTIFRATLNPKIENKFYKNYPVELFSPINLKYKNSSKNETININANLLSAKLIKKDGTLSGNGNIGSSKFTLSTKKDTNKKTKLLLSAKIKSIKKLLSELKLSSPADTTIHEGEVELNSTIILADEISIKNEIFLPWYRVTTDSETIHLIKDISIAAQYSNKNLILKSYDAKYNNQRFYSNRTSTLLIDEDDNIIIEKFWLYDNLLATGVINTTKKNVSLDIKSDKFTYNDKDANLSAKADIHASLDFSGKQTIKGDITLLEGVISYEPAQDYIVKDKDIIVIQDIKKSYNSNRFINLNINSLSPINYKTKDINLNFTPNIVLSQEPSSQLNILGIVSIHDGIITNNDKEFIVVKSEIYFNNNDAINPQLNLNLHYFTLNYIDIEILITNTLNSPVVIFSSTPAMSQNDIISYILFGEPAGSLFDGSEGSTKVSVNSLLVGSGLKQIFSDTAGIKIDTLNILTNKEGTLGYEIGTRFRKDFRIVYVNDTASSVVLQYSINKSMRFDVDIYQSQQGVSIIYVKDF